MRDSFWLCDRKTPQQRRPVTVHGLWPSTKLPIALLLAVLAFPSTMSYRGDESAVMSWKYIGRFGVSTIQASVHTICEPDGANETVF